MYAVTLSLAKKLKCSDTVSLSNRTLCCGQIPKLYRIKSISLTTSSPLIAALPSVGGYNPVSIDIVVVFPAPL
uniref:Uncharacterized protein n=1 Tax=Amphimedon queenslandica TaxID=400682 RepID=A0A1X7TTD6_AMPQE